jgi:sugar lactone lactonase YvrE
MRCYLAESPIYHVHTDVWFWVDILAGELYCGHNTVDGIQPELLKKFEFNISNIVTIDENHLLLSGEDVLIIFNLTTKQIEHSIGLNLASCMRCNDGAVGHDGRYWFGTMEKKPTGLNGQVYSLDLQWKLKQHKASIGIPNTFIWLDDDTVLISDSFLQKTFKIKRLTSDTLDWENKEVWLDFSGTSNTPDGGALDCDGNVWLAIWGAGAVHQYSSNGVLLNKIELNALQPTSCSFGGKSNNELLITTATEGLSDQQLLLYPDSGCVLLHQTSVQGCELHRFNLDI